MAQFGTRNPADVLKEPMWQMFMTFGQQGNVQALKDYVYDLIQMATQKTAGQRADKRKDLDFNDLDMTLWGIVIEATALVLSGELDNKIINQKGHWEWVQYDYNPKFGNWHCSECRCVVLECVDKEKKGGIPLYKYCPQCGAKMVEIPTESGGLIK